MGPVDGPKLPVLYSTVGKALIDVASDRETRGESARRARSRGVGCHGCHLGARTTTRPRAEKKQGEVMLQSAAGSTPLEHPLDNPLEGAVEDGDVMV